MTLHLRPLRGTEELDLFNRIPYALNNEVAGDLEAGRRHPDWLWVAVDDDDRLLARVGFWSRAGDPQPLVLDIFDMADAQAGDELLRAALATLPAHPEYTRFLPPDWHDDDTVRPEMEARIAALEGTGASVFVERLRLHWEPGTPVPAPNDRLVFRQPRDEGDLVGLMTRVLQGTLDAHGRDELTRMTPAESAQQMYDEELTRYASPRDWWRIASLPDGSPAGFVIPAHNGYNPIIAYLGVLPELRGQGYIDDILAEGTRVHAAHDVPRIRAATDLGNVPMARAFARAGYVVFERQLDMVWPG